MANTIKIKRSSVSGKVPTTSQLELGELAVNTHDGKLYTKKDDGTAAVVEIGGASASADSLTTARTIALSGDVSGSTSFDGSANVTITATVADDSHNHIISNVDGLQTALDAKLPLAGGQLTGNITFSGAQTVDGRDLSADGSKLDGIEAGATADQTAAEILTAIKTVDGAGSGLDADTLDGVQGSSYAQLASPALTGTPTAPTAAAGTNTTQLATTAFVSTAVANVVDAAPGALDTLNELAAALGDDANFSTTVTNSIATKLPLAGGQMTGNITFSSTQTVDGRDLSVDGAKLDGIEAGATADQTASEILTAIKTVDGSGSGLDADTVDGLNSSSFLRSDASDTATGFITFQNSNDYQIALNGNSTAWAGISFTDSGGSDVMWFNGANGTFALGGGGSNVAGKKLHVDGGLSVGATSDGTSTPTNGIYSQGDISVGGNTVLNAGNYTSYSPSLTGSGASGTWGISITGNSATTSQRSFSNDISTTGQGRFTGWYSGGASTGAALEVGYSSGQGYIITYDRGTSAYGITNISGSSCNLRFSGSTINVTQGALQQGGSQVLHAGNYTSYSPSLTGSGASGTWGISITGSAGSVGSTLTRGSYLTGSNFNGSSATTWAVDATTTGTANKIVARDGSGHITGNYIFGSYLNMSHGASTRSSDTIFYSSTDNYLRKNNASGMRSSLNVPTRTGGDASGTWGINITGNASGTSGYVASQGSYSTSASTTAANYGQNVRLDFVRSNEGWPSYGSVLHWSAYSSGGGGCQFYAPYGSAYGGTQLRYRLADYNNGNNWTSWKTIPDLDATQTFNGANRGQVDALSSSSSITPNFANSNNFSVTLATNTTINNPSNLVAGQSGAITIYYSGNRTVAFGSYWKFPGGTAPTMTSTSGKYDVIVYYVESSTRISAQVLLNTGG